jgi:hypothetical protein
MKDEAKKRVVSDSAVYKGSFYGILNADGDFWTPLAFDSEDKARQHIIDFWGLHKDSRDQCLRTHRIVPVRIRLTLVKENPHVE